MKLAFFEISIFILFNSANNEIICMKCDKNVSVEVKDIK